jgi:hypothetical protein
MRVIRVTWIALVLTVAAHPAIAQGWSVGTNFGLAVVQPQSGGDNLITVGLPGSVGQFAPGFQPGFRVGILAPRGEIYLDAGLGLLSGSGETLSTYQFGANGQLNFSAGSTSPYVTGGVGLLGISFVGENFTNTVAGGGFGVYNKIAEGHGRLRAEARLDYVFENTQGIDAATVFGIKLGFDLLMH